MLVAWTTTFNSGLNKNSTVKHAQACLQINAGKAYIMHLIDRHNYLLELLTSKVSETICFIKGSKQLIHVTRYNIYCVQLCLINRHDMLGNSFEKQRI